MNGLLLIFLFAFVAQGPSEVLPGPLRGNAPAIPNQPVLPPGPSPSSASKVTVGYGYDTEGIYCMIIQIAPDAIAVFAQGDRGQELQAMIPPEIRDHVQRVIVRVGTGEVERILPKSQTFSSSRNNSPYIASLGPNSNPTPVSIDPPRNAEVMPTSGTNGGFGNNNNGSGPSLNLNPPPLNSMTNTNNVAPSLNTPNLSGNPNWDRSSQNNWAGSNTPNSSFTSPDPNSRFINTNAQSSGYPGNGSPTSEVLPSTSLTGNDRFSPTGANRTPSALDILRSNNNTNAPLPGNSGFSGYAGATNSNSYGRANPGTYLAQNQNPYSGYSDPQAPLFPSTNPNNNYPNTPNFQTSYPPPITSGVPSLTHGNGYASGMTPTGMPGYRTATNPIPTTAGTSTNNFPGSSSFPQAEHSQQAVATNRFLQYFSLFSVVANVYLMIWMVHLRTRYRELVSNMRGIPISELS